MHTSSPLVRSCVVAHSSAFNKKPAPKVGFSQPRLLHIFIEKQTQFETKNQAAKTASFAFLSRRSQHSRTASDPLHAARANAAEIGCTQH